MCLATVSEVPYKAFSRYYLGAWETGNSKQSGVALSAGVIDTYPTFLGVVAWFVRPERGGGGVEREKNRRVGCRPAFSTAENLEKNGVKRWLDEKSRTHGTYQCSIERATASAIAWKGGVHMEHSACQMCLCLINTYVVDRTPFASLLFII